MLLIGQDRQSIEDYIQSVGHVPAGFMVYTSINEMDGLFSPAVERGAGIQDAAYLAHTYPHAVFQVGLYMVGSLKDTLEGKYDQNIDKLARWIDSVRLPVYLRIGYEFDFPENNYDPTLYKQAYRYIVEGLNARKVKNVQYVWHSYAVIQEDKPVDMWYPGDDVVDWVGISYFRPYFHRDRIKLAEYARQKNKPLMIAEATPSGIGVHEGSRSWQKWYGPFFNFIESYDVRIACYINTDWGSHSMFENQNWGDSRVQANREVFSLWKKEIARPKFLKYHQHHF